MPRYRVAIIGNGRRVMPDGQVRQGISYHHAPAYLSHPNTEIVALADINPEASQAYAEHFKLEAVPYTDYQQMLEQVRPDMVSICTWTGLHPEMVITCARAGVRAIHCEKPMAPTWGEAKRMAAACAETGTQLTFNHQRRFGRPFITAKALLADGAIGELRRLEGQCANMMDWGTHWLDMFFHYNDDVPAAWVLGQIDKRTDRSVFGLAMDDQAVCWFGFQNEVQGLLRTGTHAVDEPENRLIGTTGTIEVGCPDGRSVRLRTDDQAGWRTVELKGGIHGGEAFEGAIHDAIDALTEGREPMLAARKALQSTEVIFATYESSRRRGRVDLPLPQEDSALLTMLEEGLIGPEREVA